MNDAWDPLSDVHARALRQSLERCVAGRDSSSARVLERLGGRTPEQIMDRWRGRVLARVSAAAAVILVTLAAAQQKRSRVGLDLQYEVAESLPPLVTLEDEDFVVFSSEDVILADVLWGDVE